MEAIILCGIQSTGKSTFCKDRFQDTHIRLNLDTLKTRRREEILFRACLEAKAAVVIDNTNPTREERARYVLPAKEAGFRVIGYYFESRVSDSLSRNSQRAEHARVPDAAIRGTSARLEVPTPAEGFDALYHVKIGPEGFVVSEWRDEV